jgi:hypothetical protein
MDSVNNLVGMRTYLVGAMDRVPDCGIEWRQRIGGLLRKMGVTVIDPCNKPIDGVIENEDTRNIIDSYKETGQFDKIKPEFGIIRNADLRCVDISDFIIAYIDIDIHACGTYEEIVTANRQKKPVLVWCKQGKRHAPNWLFFMLPHEHIFNSLSEILGYLDEINNEQDVSKLKRWFFFKYNKVNA